MTEQNTIPTLAERLSRVRRIARRRWKILVATTCVATVAALAVAAHGSTTYTATSRLVLGNQQLVGVPTSVPTMPNPDPERDINTKVALITSTPVAAAVDARLRLGMPVSQLLKKVQAAPEGTSNIIDVTVTDASRANAALIANAFAQQYVRYRATIGRSSLQRAAAGVSQQLKALSPAARNGPVGAALNTQLQQLNLDSDGQESGAVVVADASRAGLVAAQPSKTIAVVGAIAGLLLGIAIVAVLELMDTRLKDVDDVTSNFAVRVLAEVPRARPTSKGSLGTDGSRGQTEAYDALGSQVLLAARRRPLSSLMLTSPGRGDGKTAVALGLARALTRLDHRVLVIETDPTNSIIANSRPRAAGLSGVLLGKSTVADAVVRVDEPSASGTAGSRGRLLVLPGDEVVHVDEPSAAGTAGGRGQLLVLPAGHGGASSPRLLSRPELADILSAGKELADFVLIDGPATPRLHDALGLVDSVDAALLVARLRWTDTNAFDSSVETLDLLAMRVLGVVLTGSLGQTSSPRAVRGGALIPLDASENGNGNGDRRRAAPPTTPGAGWHHR